VPVRGKITVKGPKGAKPHWAGDVRKKICLVLVEIKIQTDTDKGAESKIN